ncbi:hypothetical protein KCP75_05295 [Salmonella enterica subsp. enterica]|nr:hypothetical protein KCP75_05295 [Salmonella enterica subsp. enterica]
MWISGAPSLSESDCTGMAVSTIGIFQLRCSWALHLKLCGLAEMRSLAGLLFGFGIVLAGGCETGWMYRAP